MAEALFTRSAGSGHEARSAGSDPATSFIRRLWPRCESSASSSVDGRLGGSTAADSEWADVVVTMGCGDACPVIPGKRYVDWELEDPAGKPPADVRRIRDRILSLTSDLAGELG